ncbi:MAG: phytoene/squalene synthase family protein [Planctomycetes bacterium]|nr:phytoene/squalene synthase family protein [Planctomycetota bacterium]
MIVSQRADAAFCQSILKKSGSNFALPLRLLSPEKRRGSNALYAFCRLADDIIDGEGALSDKSQAIDEFERMLRNALNGQVVDDPVLRSIACTADRYTIPHEHLFAIVKGVRSDLTQSRYETTDDLIEYCRRVASAVGLAAVPIWGLRRGISSEDWVPPADACGLAFQWTNILRDIVEDRERGRVYISRESFREAGCDVQDLLAGRIGSAFKVLASNEVSRANRWFAEARQLDEFLSIDGQRVFRAMYGVYRELFRSVEQAGSEVFIQRVRASKWRLPVMGIYSVLAGIS